jgi:hypothetical protein
MENVLIFGESLSKMVRKRVESVMKEDSQIHNLEGQKAAITGGAGRSGH